MKRGDILIIDHTFPAYKNARKKLSKGGRNNGAYYYSKEIIDNIIPYVDTDRSWVTVRIDGACLDHAIVFIHNNLNPERYDYLKQFKDLILVCGVPQTCAKVVKYGTPIYLPLSIDTEYVRRFWTDQRDIDEAFVGRRNKRLIDGATLPEDIVCFENMSRDALLANMARCKKVYAVGRCAIEAKALGCEIGVYDQRFPDPNVWKVIDNREAAELLNRLIREIDG